MDFIAVLQREWPVISQAPWSVATIVVVAFVAALWLGRFWRAETVTNLQSRLERRDEEIDALKAKLAAPTVAVVASDHPDRRAIRERLGAFIKEGEVVIGYVPKGEGMERGRVWSGKVAAYLSSALDQSYVTRFESTAGIPSRIIVGSMTAEQKNLFRVLDLRILRLHEFLSELT